MSKVNASHIFATAKKTLKDVTGSQLPALAKGARSEPFIANRTAFPMPKWSNGYANALPLRRGRVWDRRNNTFLGACGPSPFRTLRCLSSFNTSLDML